uniref:Uncharacterized protein n=1 Tax=Arsenophonus nasoniae TaxID=638 RepID=D2U223_9GAMM|nr:hypothetical protein ARN_26270 [Arsenophonus nasoniae]
MKFINNFSILRKINNDLSAYFPFIFLALFIILSANKSFKIKKLVKKCLFYSIKYHLITPQSVSVLY